MTNDEDIRRCYNCVNSKDGHISGTETCHECMWNSQYKPQQKNINDVLEEIKANLQTLSDDKWNQQVMASKGLDIAIEIIENYQDKMEVEE